jgi:large subunit ribosomal protein L40e
MHLRHTHMHTRSRSDCSPVVYQVIKPNTNSFAHLFSNLNATPIPHQLHQSRFNVAAQTLKNAMSASQKEKDAKQAAKKAALLEAKTKFHAFHALMEDTGVTHTLSVPPTATVSSIKVMLKAIDQTIVTDNYVMYHNGHRMSEDATIASKTAAIMKPVVAELPVLKATDKTPPVAETLAKYPVKLLKEIAMEKGVKFTSRSSRAELAELLIAHWVVPCNAIRITVTDLEGVAHVKYVLAGDNINLSEYLPQTTAAGASDDADETVDETGAGGAADVAVDDETVKETFKISIEMHTGTTITLKVKASDTIDDVKAQIKEKEAIPTDKQSLTFAGRQLKNGKLISTYNISSGSVLKMTREL